MSNEITQYTGDCREILKTLPDQSVHCCVTSPPYWGLRDYGVDGQIGLEKTPDEFVAEMVAVFREVRRVLRDDGTAWVNLGDSYARAQETNVVQTKNKPVAYPIHAKKGSSDDFVGRADRPGVSSGCLPPKNLVGIPWRVAFALQADGWYLRQDIIWSKPNPMPESVTDRCTKAHEYIFLLSKKANYYYDNEVIKEQAGGWNGSLFDDGKNLLVYPNVGKRHVPGNKSHKGTAAYEDGDNKHRTKSGLVRFAEKFRVAEERKELRTDTESRHRSSIPGGQSLEENPTGFRNRRSVWTISTQPYSGSHFAVFPEKLIEPCILAGCPEGGVVLDPFGGSGTTARVAIKNRRKAIIIELNPEYIVLQNERTSNVQIRLI